MNLIYKLGAEPLVNALGWTLLHSLWQGALISLTLALLLVLLQRHTATLRYYMAIGAMLLQLLVSGATFGYHYTAATPEPTATAAATEQVHVYGQTTVLSTIAATNWQQALSVTQLYFEQHLPFIVTLWLLGLLVMALRFMGGLAYAQRLRYQKCTLLGEKWQDIKQQLATQIGVKQVVQLAESALVKVPVVVGLAKPVILLPIGAVAGLSTVQVEAILAHELAHIRRNDYLVNVLQSVVDILFFYHPGMWWISATVREERENCCDDVAVAVCGNPLAYARALAVIAEMQLTKSPAVVMALAGRKGTLLGRIRRLVQQPALRPTFSEGFMAALVLVVGVLFLSVGAMASIKDDAGIKPEQKPALKETIVEHTSELVVPVSVTAEEEHFAYSLTLQDTTGRTRDIVIIKNKKGDVAELYVNGKKIPKKDIPAYSSLIEERLEAAKRAPKAKRVEVDREIMREREAVARAPRNRGNKRQEYLYEYRSGHDGLAVPPPPAPPAPMSPVPPVPPMPPVPVPPAPPAPLELNGQNKEELKKQQKAYEETMKEYEKDMKRFQEEMKQHALEREALVNERREANAQRRQQRVDIARHNREESMQRLEASKARRAEAMKRNEELAGILDNVSNELMKDGLLEKNAAKVDFRIDDTGLYVDGKKQPQEVYSKYRSLMKTKDGKSLNYTYKKDGDNKQVIIKD
ncbi:MAG TPA: M56 family metallopeptidase [Pontibacter sp.]